MSTRAFDLGQAANNFVTVLPDLTAPPSVGDILTAASITSGVVQTKFNAPSTIGTGGGTFLPMNGGGTISPAYLRLDGPPATSRPLWFSSSLSSRWQLSATSDVESGNNVGSNLGIYAFADNGSYIGSPLSIGRASGPTGMSGPYIYNLAPWRQLYAIGSSPNAVIGNRQDLGIADRQPAMPLSNNPLATTAGSPIVTVTWLGSCSSTSGWIGANQFGSQTWVNLQGATTVGGITPTGWLQVQTLVDNDHFTVRWSANATATATGGGAAVTAQPSHCTTLNRVQSVSTTGAWGYPCQTAELFAAQPDFTVPPGSASIPRYEHRWHWTTSPNDALGVSSWNTTAIEWDLTNRGHDYGYQPNIYRADQPTVGFWVGPVGVVPALTSGGTPINWGTVYTVFSGQNDNTTIGVYQAFSCMPNSLVGQKYDPTAHGGVGVDLFGSYSVAVINNPLSTTSGSPSVGVQMWVGELIGMTNGDRVYIPNSYTINGVSIPAGTYVMSNVNTAAGTFSITGTGNATATGSGGGLGVTMSFLPLAPYAPFQTWGQFQHGLISAPGSQFLSGGIVETQPGNGILWNDGGGGIASVNTAAGSPGNMDLTINPAGTGWARINTNITIQNAPGAGEVSYRLFGNTGQQKTVYFATGNQNRWSIGTDSGTESGSDAGAPFIIARYHDAGNWAGNVLTINRATGNATFSQSIGVNGTTPPAKPTVTGAKNTNSALASLLTALASYGLITDSTTA